MHKNSNSHAMLLAALELGEKVRPDRIVDIFAPEAIITRMKWFEHDS